MANFTNAVYDITKMGNPAPIASTFYSLTSVGSEFSLVTPGTYNSMQVVGVAYNSVDFTGAAALAAVQVVTLSGRDGDTPTVLHFYKNVPAGVTMVLGGNRYNTTFTAISSLNTVVVSVSDGGYFHIGPEARRKWNLNG